LGGGGHALAALPAGRPAAAEGGLRALADAPARAPDGRLPAPAGGLAGPSPAPVRLRPPALRAPAALHDGRPRLPLVALRRLCGRRSRRLAPPHRGLRGPAPPRGPPPGRRG